MQNSLYCSKYEPYGMGRIPMKITWEMTTRCNLNCMHCYSTSVNNGKRSELSIDDSMQLINTLINEEVLFLLLDGGEPLLKDGFYDLLRIASSKMCTWLSTNGTLIDHEAAIELKNSNIGAVFVSLHSSDKLIHDKITGCNGSYEATVRGIEQLKKYGVKTIMTSVVLKQNVNTIRENIRIANDLGVEKLIFLRPYAIGRGMENKSEIMPSLEELRDAITSIDKHESRLPISHAFGLRNHNCCVQAMSIFEDGSIRGCPYLRNLPSYGVFPNDSLRKSWYNSLSVRIQRTYEDIPLVCQKCDNVKNCEGGCKASTYIEYNDFSRKDPFCWVGDE